jgi:hypothetical protein
MRRRTRLAHGFPPPPLLASRRALGSFGFSGFRALGQRLGFSFAAIASRPVRTS